MKKLFGIVVSVSAIIGLYAACTTNHHVGFGPGDPWSTTAPTGLQSNYAGTVVAPAFKSSDAGMVGNTFNCAPGNPATLTFSSAGLDQGDSGIVGDSCSGVVNIFFDGGVILTSTPLVTVNMPFFFADAGGPVFQGAGGATVLCQHGNGMLGLTEGPVELGTNVYCRMIVGDGGNGGASNQFNIYEGPNPLAASGILNTVAHDAGPGLFQVQYHVIGHP